MTVQIIRSAFKSMSITKKSVTAILQSQIAQLHSGVVQMNEESLLKQLAKRRVLYNLNRQGEVQVVYSYLALSEYYLNNGFKEAALHSLKQSRDLKITGDSSYLIGMIYFGSNNEKEALKHFERALSQPWIQPSIDHQTASKLECMTHMQKIYYNLADKDKLTALAHEKIRLCKQQNPYLHTQNYFHALTLADLAVIHDTFGETKIAIDKIVAAIMLLEQHPQDTSKLIHFYKIAGSLYRKTGKSAQEKRTYEKALQLINRFPKCVSEDVEADIYESIIKCNLLPY